MLWLLNITTSIVFLSVVYFYGDKETRTEAEKEINHKDQQFSIGHTKLLDGSSDGGVHPFARLLFWERKQLLKMMKLSLKKSTQGRWLQRTSKLKAERQNLLRYFPILV